MRRKGPLIAAAVPAGLLLAAAAVLVLLRVPILQAVLERQLAARGLPEARLQVAAVGLDGLSLEDLALDAEGTLAARRVRLGYSLDSLADGRVEHIRVKGLRLALDLRREEPLAPLRPLLAGGGEPPAVPPTTLSDVTVEAATPAGRMVLRFDGHLSPEPAGGRATAVGSLALAGDRLSGAFRATLAPLAPDMRLALSETELRAATPMGTVTVELRGEIAPQGGGTATLSGSLAGLDGRLTGDFRLIAAAVAEAPTLHLRETRLRLATAAGELSAELTADAAAGADGGKATVEARVRGPQDSVTADVRARAAPLAPDARLDLEADATAEAASPLWADLGLAAPAGGRAHVALRAAGRLPSGLPGTGPLPLLASAAAAGLAGEADVRLDAAREPGWVEGLTGQAKLGFEAREGELALRLRQPATAQATMVDARGPAALGLPPPAADLLARARRARIEAWTDAGDLLVLRPADGGLVAAGRGTLEVGFDAGTARASLAGEAGVAGGRLARLALTTLDLRAEGLALAGAELRSAAASGWLDGAPPELDGEFDVRLDLARLAAGGLELGEVDVRAPLAVAATAAGGATASLRRGAEVTVGAPPSLGPLELQGLIALTARSGRIARGADGALAYGADLALGPVAGRLRREDAEPLAVELQPGDLQVDGRAPPGGAAGLRLRLAETRAAAPALGLAAEGITAETHLGSGRAPLARVALGALRSTAEPALFAPLTGRATVRRAGGAIAATGELGPASHAVRAAIEARHDPATAAGRLRIEVAELAFAPDGLQPEDLSPLMARLRRAEGEVAAEAEITWSPDGLNSAGVLRFDGLDLEAAQARVEGLAGTIAFDRLVPPPSTPPAQELTAERVVAGVPLTEARVRLSLERGQGVLPVLRIERAESRFGGGRLRLDDARLAPAEREQALTVEVDRLDLARLFEDLAVEGLDGTGELSGEVPLRWTGETVVIEAGRLSAAGDGVLRYRSEAAERALAGGGEQVRLMLSALRDFRYEELTVTVERSADGRLELGVSTLGRNPDVLDGYPFRINIALTGDVDPLLDALAEGRRLTDALLRRALELRRQEP